MTNISAMLKEMISRQAKREFKAQSGKTKRAIAQYRRDIAQLKRKVNDQQRQIASLRKREAADEGAEEAETSENRSRFSARSVRAQRKRLRLSAQEFARLVGVSPLTVYHWEHGKSRPRKAQFAALVAVRKVGRREARARLDEAKSGGGRKRRRAR